jgi:phage tail-like protein
MRAVEPTFWLLDGRTGWCSAKPLAEPGQPATVTVGERSGIRLSTTSDGPLALTSADGRMGGLRLPRAMTIDQDGLVYLLGQDTAWVKRFDPQRRTFVELTIGGAGRPNEPPFTRPLAIAAVADRLYVADGGERELWALARSSLGLMRRWRLLDPAYRPIAAHGGDTQRYVFLANATAAAEYLRFPATGLAEHLHNLLAETTRSLLDPYRRGEPVTPTLREALTADLDGIVLGPSLYTKERLRRVTLSAATRRLAANPAADPLELNRRLLEEATSGAIDTRAWLPVDLAAAGESVYVLDRRYGRVYRHDRGADTLALVVDQPASANGWSSLAIDLAGRIYLLNADTPQLAVFDARGAALGTLSGAENVRDRFAPPAIHLDHKQRFRIPESLARLCDRAEPDPPPSIEDPLGRYSAAPPLPARRSALIEPDDVADSVLLAVGLRGGRDPLTHFIRRHLSDTARLSLDAFGGLDEIDAELAQDLRATLNALLLDADLAAPQLIACIDADAALQAALDAPAEGEQRTRRNRLILEAALGPALRPLDAAPLAPLIFDRAGALVTIDPTEPYGPAVYLRQGVWYSAPLDSARSGCQWHRIELELGQLPEGASVTVCTFADEQLRDVDTIGGLRDNLWSTCYKVVGRAQPAEASQPGALRHEFLIQSREGRYLWLKIVLEGDGYVTPATTSLRVHFPRESYLGYLPAVYQADDESRWFLERFLSVFQTEWDDLARRVEELAAYYDPLAVPADHDGAHLAYLASLLALPLEGDWDVEQKRRLLAAAPRLTPRRGTNAGLREYLQIYLENLTGLTPAVQGGYPLIIEGFRERRRVQLSLEPGAMLGQVAPLWSAAQVGRLQLGVFAQEGEARLVSTGDPERDLFHEYAHRFRVFVPAAWVRTGAADRMVRRALDAEKPAHTRYDLCLVEPRLRVGIQATVGIDTIVGAYPVAYLACPHQSDEPAGREPRGRLGYDTILAAAEATHEWRLTPPGRVGNGSQMLR